MKYTKVKIGLRFRSNYADAFPLWEVKQARGKGSWLCEIIDEPGKPGLTEWSGVEKLFMTREILSRANTDEFFAIKRHKHDVFYRSLEPDSIVHYDDGFGKYVRCKVVRKDEQTRLMPIALVGAWESFDLPSRGLDGGVHLGHWGTHIVEQKTFDPYYATIFESPDHENTSGLDPRELEPINFSLPEMTGDERKSARLWSTVNEAARLLDDAYGSQDVKDTLGKPDVPREVLSRALALIQTALGDDQ